MRTKNGLMTERSGSNKENDIGLANMIKGRGSNSARNLHNGGVDRASMGKCVHSAASGKICKLKIDITNLSSKAIGNITSKNR
jgi:hypothetical protein